MGSYAYMSRRICAESNLGNVVSGVVSSKSENVKKKKKIAIPRNLDAMRVTFIERVNAAR